MLVYSRLSSDQISLDQVERLSLNSATGVTVGNLIDISSDPGTVPTYMLTRNVSGLCIL